MKNNNEILSISLFTISTFILISLIQFDEIYNITDIYDLIFLGDSKEIDYPVTGPLGASLSALLKKYFLGHGSFTICSILFMYSFLLFTQKDYKHKKYITYSIYQLLFGLWLAVFFAWNESSNLSSSSGIIGLLLHDFLFFLIFLVLNLFIFIINIWIGS